MISIYTCDCDSEGVRGVGLDCASLVWPGQAQQYMVTNSEWVRGLGWAGLGWASLAWPGTAVHGHMAQHYWKIDINLFPVSV